ncbi:MAG: hypothetical protein AAB317_01550 [Nitrospirota bacterium]
MNATKSVTATFAGWGVAELVERDDAGNAESPQVAFDAAGNAIAVWKQFDGARNNIWANRFVPGTGWGTAQLIETDPLIAESPQVAVDAAGNAIAVWILQIGTTGGKQIWSNRFVATTTRWGTPVLVQGNAAQASQIDVAVDVAGNAIAVWSQHDGNVFNVYANRFVATTASWGTTTRIETNAGNPFSIDVAFDAAGNAIAVWQQARNIYANRFVATTASWGTAEIIETDNVPSADTPRVAVDTDGNAIAVWVQIDGARFSTLANRFVATTTSWGTPEIIRANNLGTAASPQVAVDASGNAIAVWQQFGDGGLRGANIWANRFVAGTGWGTAQLVETNAETATSPQVAVDAAGNAIAVWQQIGDFNVQRNDIWANRFVAGTGLWGASVLLETDNTGTASFPQVAVDTDGDAIAVWQQSNGTRTNIWANRFE